jgi:1-acyl-sn-glycerol-3-phosphate acyltransferase
VDGERSVLARVALRVWGVLYEIGYGCLRGASLLLFRPFFRVRRVGPPRKVPRGGVIVCANHASYLDPAFLQFVIPRRVTYLMTNTFYQRKGARWFFKLVCAIPVDSGRLAHQGMRRAIDLLRKGRLVGIFPEGRLTRDGTLSPAQRGVAILARMAGVPVLPLGIAGSFRAWPHGARRPRRADVRVAFGRPLFFRPDPDHDRDDEQAFAERVMAEVAAAFRRAEEAGSARFTSRPEARR